MKRHTIITVLAALLACPVLAQQGTVTVRIKDVTNYRLTGANPLVGEGLVVGLAGTGDKDDEKAMRMAQALSDRAGDIAKTLKPEDFASTNISRVTVMASIDEGSTVAGANVTAKVTAEGNTKSLEGGILVPTSLRIEVNGKVYANAFGMVVTSKRPGGGGGGGNNQGATTGTVSATLVEDVRIPFFDVRMTETGEEKRMMILALDNPDINTANDIVAKINGERESLGLSSGTDKPIAKGIGLGEVEIEIPRKWWDDELKFRYHIDNISINPDVAAS
ncbi:MAG: flagellar basal body P-ring protein FlgI, partial [Planctomycetes bacterium]|nr:flagellar basal body P-ring protein FlgI [Planctomycetota bacterium]